MEWSPEWLTVILTSVNGVITLVYVIATCFIWAANKKSADAAQRSTQVAIDALEESKKQFKQNIELQKQHNIDSVRPAVSIHYSSSGNPDAFLGYIKITNHGLGPAIIKGMRFKNDNGKEYNNPNGYCTFFDLVKMRVDEEKLDLQVKKVFVTYYTKEFRNQKDDADFLAVNEDLPLLEFRTINRKDADNVAKIFQGLSVDLIYTDIFNSDEWIVSKRLTYFVHSWEGHRTAK